MESSTFNFQNSFRCYCREIPHSVILFAMFFFLHCFLVSSSSVRLVDRFFVSLCAQFFFPNFFSFVWASDSSQFPTEHNAPKFFFRIGAFLTLFHPTINDTYRMCRMKKWNEWVQWCSTGMDSESQSQSEWEMGMGMGMIRVMATTKLRTAIVGCHTAGLLSSWLSCV